MKMKPEGIITRLEDVSVPVILNPNKASAVLLGSCANRRSSELVEAVWQADEPEEVQICAWGREMELSCYHGNWASPESLENQVPLAAHRALIKYAWQREWIGIRALAGA